LDPHRRGYTEQLSSLAREYHDGKLADNLAVRYAVQSSSKLDQMRLLDSCLAAYPDGDAAIEAAFRLGDLESQSAGAENDIVRSRGLDRLAQIVERFPESTWALDASERLKLLQRTIARSDASESR